MGWLCSYWSRGYNTPLQEPGGSTESAVIWGQEWLVLGYSIFTSFHINKNSLAYILYNHNDSMETLL